MTKGTKEWASSNVNIFYGCSNNCKYCYAKQMWKRFRHQQRPKQWEIMEPNQKAIDKNYGKRKGRIMFPTSHDITDESYENCLKVLRKLLWAENKVLITTKPRFGIIKKLCEELRIWKKQIQFRFTITSLDDGRFEFWEPGAPLFKDRLDALKLAYAWEFKTSVSMEPFLDPTPWDLFGRLKNWVSESIWIGPMNHIPDHPDYQMVREYYRKENLQRIYDVLKDEPLVRWKDAFLEKLK